MAYINKDKSASIRKALKAAFPKWRFNVRIDHHSSLNVVIKSADINLLDYAKQSVNMLARDGDEYFKQQKARGYMQVNQYHMASNWENPALDLLNQVIAICNEGNHDNSDIQSDYFDVGWYFSLSIGNYDKPFEVK